tara:strand:+ start:1004 stop:1492 length:489 start_codon:yes stop_codon:yes gene_type:complete
MDLKETRDILNKFAKYVIKQARTNLTKGKKNSSKKLYESLDYKLKLGQNSFGIEFIMEEYGAYQDQGVSGKKRKFDTPFSFTNKMPPSSSLDKWGVRKGIAPRDKQGKFIPRKSLNFIIARSIFMKGIRPSMFFTKPFEKAFDNLPPELTTAFAIDIENSIE